MATVYISPNGSNSTGDGSKDNPWQTQSHAENNTSDGDTIIFLNGTYSFSSFNQVRTYQGESRDGVFIEPGSGNNWGAGGQDNTVRRMTVQGFRNTNVNVSMWEVTTNGGTMNVEEVTFRNLEAEGGNTGDKNGLFSNRSNGNPVHMIFTSCTFYNITRATTASLASLIGGNSGTIRYEMYNCTWHFDEIDADAPDAVFGGGDDADNVFIVKNNIFMNESGTTIGVFGGGTASSDITTDHNDYFNMSDTPTLGSNDITSDPLFNDSTNHDFDLRPGSPCINAGDPSI